MTAAENDGANTATARNNLLAGGIDTIDGLAILGEGGLEARYNANFKGGTGAFVEVANDFTDFADAIQRKLTREIGVPEHARPARPRRDPPSEGGPDTVTDRPREAAPSGAVFRLAGVR